VKSQGHNLKLRPAPPEHLHPHAAVTAALAHTSPPPPASLLLLPPPPPTHPPVAMSTVINNNPLAAPHLFTDPRLQPSRSGTSAPQLPAHGHTTCINISARCGSHIHVEPQTNTHLPDATNLTMSACPPRHRPLCKTEASPHPAHIAPSSELAPTHLQAARCLFLDCCRHSPQTSSATWSRTSATSAPTSARPL
jgi:hypothetical protein